MPISKSLLPTKSARRPVIEPLFRNFPEFRQPTTSLLPMFKKAAIIISLRRQGGEIKSTDEMDMALGMSDFMNFVFLVFVFFNCSTCLLLEIFCFHNFNKTFIHQLNFQKGKSQIKYKIRRHST